MSLTGIPLIVVAVLGTGAIAAVTVLLWSRFGRWRPLSRAAGILLTETLVVVTIGLVVNRADMFYPSWAALEGRTGTTAVAATRRAGRLDGLVRGAAAATLSWRPADAAGWRLAGTARVVFPAGYRQRPSVAYPAVVSLVDSQAEAAAAVRVARRVAAVGVVAVPSARTTAAALATLPTDLAADVRVNARGWAVLTTLQQAALAARLVRPGGSYGALVVVGATALPRADRPGDVSLAIVRPGRPHHAVPADRGTAMLTASGPAAWSTAENWAAVHTSPPLAAPLQLPAAGGTVPAGPGGKAGRR
jgi:hypothetical protein